MQTPLLNGILADSLYIVVISFHPHAVFSPSGHVFGLLCFGEGAGANVLACSFGATIQEKTYQFSRSNAINSIFSTYQRVSSVLATCRHSSCQNTINTGRVLKLPGVVRLIFAFNALLWRLPAQRVLKAPSSPQRSEY